MDFLRKNYVKNICQPSPNGEDGMHGIKKPTRGENIACQSDCITETNQLQEDNRLSPQMQQRPQPR
jgi:hypothetical protein